MSGTNANILLRESPTHTDSTPSTSDQYLGIPSSLLYKLVEVYYDNVYNATLLLHKQTFLDSLAAGTVRPHIVLSVCAFAAKYELILLGSLSS
jgi:hypothetical protein